MDQSIPDACIRTTSMGGYPDIVNISDKLLPDIDKLEMGQMRNTKERFSIVRRNL